MDMKRTGMLVALVAALSLLASSAFAGPVWKFGKKDQGLLKLEYKAQFQLRTRDTGASPDGDERATEFNFRRNRIALMGAYGKNFGLYVQTDFNEDDNVLPLSVSDGGNSNFQILDAVMRFKLPKDVNLWVGKFKYNLTRESLEACNAPLTLDRSVLIRAPFVTTRDKGVAVWGNLFDDKVQYRVDAMNGRSDSESSPKSNLRYSARAHLTLLDPEKGYGYKGTYMGEKKILTFGAAYQFEEDVAFAGAKAVDYAAWTADAFFEYPVEELGTVTLSGAYVDYDLGDAFKNGSPDEDVTGVGGEKNGGYVKAGYMLPKLPLQFFARAENWSFAKLDDIFDQEIDWYGGGFNYYLRGQALKLTAEYSVVDYDKETRSVEDFDTFTVQLQLRF